MLDTDGGGGTTNVSVSITRYWSTELPEQSEEVYMVMERNRYREGSPKLPEMGARSSAYVDTTCRLDRQDGKIRSFAANTGNPKKSRLHETSQQAWDVSHVGERRPRVKALKSLSLTLNREFHGDLCRGRVDVVWTFVSGLVSIV